jgi:branched-chain amino acid transport system ATP-binding protein
MTALLEINDVHASYGRLDVLRGASMTVEDGALVALVGPNGVGKSTLLRVIAGHLPPRSGRIRFRDVDIDGATPADIARCGIYLLPERRAVFPNLTVLENLRLSSARPERDLHGAIAESLELFPALALRLTQPAGTLSGGEQQMLALARAFCAQPVLLLLDEPSLGLAPKIVTEVFDAIARFRDSGIAVLLVEQFVDRALAACDHAYVMASGKISELSGGREQVTRTYVGGPSPRREA